MALLKRILLVTLVLLAIAGVSIAAAVWAILQPPPGLRQFQAAFPEGDWPLLAILADSAEELERLSPTGFTPAAHPALGQLAMSVRQRSEAGLKVEIEQYRVDPRGFDLPTALEVSAIHRAAQRARDAGITPADLAELSGRAHKLRATAQFSVPAIAVEQGQPVWRAAVSGRALQTNLGLKRDRRILRIAAIPASAPLDPLYPLAVAAVTSPEGLGIALDALSKQGYDTLRRSQVAFCLGQLYWWSLDRDSARFFAVLAQDQGAGEPLDRLVAMGGAVQGLNNVLLADDPAKETVPAFVKEWAEAIEAPWVDAAAAQYWTASPTDSLFAVVSQCPEAPGYLERLPAWAASNEPGERLLLFCFFSQVGYPGFLSFRDPEAMRGVSEQLPLDGARIDGMIFQAYLEEQLGDRPLAIEMWPAMMRSGLGSLATESAFIPAAFALSFAQPWQEVWPQVQARLGEMATTTNYTVVSMAWPLAPSKRGIPVCPIKRVRSGEAQPPVEDKAFFGAVDAELRRLWPTATPAFKLAVLRTHLPHAHTSGFTLDPWLAYRAEIAPQLGQIEDQEVLTQLRAVFGR